MSQENVEIVRRTIEAFDAGAARGDFEAAWETGAVADDVEWVAFAALERRSSRGREGFVEFMSHVDRGFRGVVGPAGPIDRRRRQRGRVFISRIREPARQAGRRSSRTTRLSTTWPMANSFNTGVS